MIEESCRAKTRRGEEHERKKHRWFRQEFVFTPRTKCGVPFCICKGKRGPPQRPVCRALPGLWIWKLAAWRGEGSIFRQPTDLPFFLLAFIKYLKRPSIFLWVSDKNLEVPSILAIFRGILYEKWKASYKIRDYLQKSGRFTEQLQNDMKKCEFCN